MIFSTFQYYCCQTDYHHNIRYYNNLCHVLIALQCCSIILYFIYYHCIYIQHLKTRNWHIFFWTFNLFFKQVLTYFFLYSNIQNKILAACILLHMYLYNYLFDEIIFKTSILLAYVYQRGIALILYINVK